MKVLLIAPQPFFEERGTPIAVRLLAESLCSFGHSVDLLAYHAGTDVAFAGLRLFRARRPPGVHRVPIGISWQKLACDWFLVLRMVKLLRENKYDVIHAVEEAIFPAVAFGRGSGRKVVYDMDSWLSEQLTDKWTWLRPLKRLLLGLERCAVQRSALVLPVCDDLAERVWPWMDRQRVIVLPDVPVGGANRELPAESLRGFVDGDAVLGLYVGSLEQYQGIDLLLRGIGLLPRDTRFRMVIVGGSDDNIARYRRKCVDLGIDGLVRFIGPRPLASLYGYLTQADILISPRKLGVNTPMKIYSYMQSGRAILATDIRSHAQVLDSSCASLVPPSADGLAAGLAQLTGDAELRGRLGAAARARAEERYTLAAYRRRLEQAYDLLRS